ncbi:MAG: hypothetical protein JSW58_13165, partial [Candidatus Latescibacterota bacterium]
GALDRRARRTGPVTEFMAWRIKTWCFNRTGWHMRRKRLSACERAMSVLPLLVALLVAVPTAAEWKHFDNTSDIRALYQDGNTLWVGTNGGLIFVDLSSNEVTGKITAGESLPGNSVRVIRERQGHLYVGTDAGLSLFKKDTDGIYRGEVLRQINDIRNVTWGPSGTMYIATFGHGVAEIAHRRPRWITRADSLLDDKVFAVSAVEGHDVYFATSLGLCAFIDSVWVSFQAGAGLPRGEVRDLVWAETSGRAGGREGPTFYVLISGRGVYRFSGRRARRVLPREVFDENDVAAIVAGSGQTLWAAGRYGGIARYGAGEWTGVGSDDDDITRARWRCAHAGRDGTVYFGSADGLIVAVRGKEIRKIIVPTSLPSDHIGSMVEDQSGGIYVANGAYLVSIRDDTAGVHVEKEFGSVFAIQVSPDSVVWVDTRWGLYRKVDGQWIEVRTEIDPKPPLFVSMAFDSAGNLWAGTHTGEVYRYDGELWTRFADRYELGAGSIDQMLVDNRRRVWALSCSSGLYRFDGSKWKNFDVNRFDTDRILGVVLETTGRPVLLTSKSVWRYGDVSDWELLETPDPEQIGEYRSVCFDDLGRMYLGTSQGVALVTGDGLRWIGSRDGLRGTEVSSVLVDANNNLWVGFHRDGLSRISLEKLWR